MIPTDVRALARSGLLVSPMCLGTMTFDAGRWGVDHAGADGIVNAYVATGGNFVDTADIYGGGQSEAMIGACVAARALRDRLVVATRFTWNRDPGNPNAGGNGRKHILSAVEASLRRLRTDYIDLCCVRFRDMVTPVEEVWQTLGDLVRSGRIRCFTPSDVPAWDATRMTVLAAEGGVPAPVAIQTEYSLTERTAEQEIVPAARECGMGALPWSPLAGGFLDGAYSRRMQPGRRRAQRRGTAGRSRPVR